MKQIKYLNPFGRMCISMGMIPSTYKESLTYEEQLLWLINYLENTVIPAVNGNAEATEELQKYYQELKQYVDEYFDNLDIQEEIDNKLDDMAESGELADIIAQYLELAGVLAYSTLADLKGASNITDGSITMILGKNSFNDGKTAYYKIREIENTDVVDDDNIIAITNDPNLVGEKIKNTVFVNQVDGAPQVSHIYVNASTGNDDNTGLSASQALKTLDAVFDKIINKGALITRIRIYPGTYTMRKYAYNALALHFFIPSSAPEGNVIINFDNEAYTGSEYYTIPIYNSHWNFYGNNENQKFVLNGGTTCNHLYIDGGSLALRYTDINDMRLGNNGGYLSINNCTIPDLIVRGGSLVSTSCHIGNLELFNSVAQLQQTTFDPSLNVLGTQTQYFTNVNSEIVIFGTTYINLEDEPDKDNFYFAQGGHLSLLSAINIIGDYRFSGNSHLYASILTSNQTRYNAFKSIATTINVESDCITSTLTL